MATSGTKTFNLDIAQIIEEALERVGGDPISGEEAAQARRALNLLFIHLINQSAPLSTQKLISFNTVANQASYTLTTDIINVQNVVVRDSDGKDIELSRDDILEYNRIYNKDQTGKPSTFYMDRTRTGMVMYLFPMPDQAYTVRYWGTSKIEDVSAAVQNVDIPTTYLPAIISGLAYYLSLKRRNIEPAYRQELKQLYTEELKAAFEEDRRRVDYYLLPAINGG